MITSPDLSLVKPLRIRVVEQKVRWDKPSSMGSGRAGFISGSRSISPGRSLRISSALGPVSIVVEAQEWAVRKLVPDCRASMEVGPQIF